MAANRKARSDSKVAALPPAVRAELARLISEENKSYDDAVAWLRETHRVRVGRTAVRNWFTLHSWKEEAEQARAMAAQVEQHAAASENYDAATIALIRERAYVMARTKEADIKDLVALASVIGDSVKLRLKEREVSVSERRVKLLEEKAAQADAAEGVMKDGNLTTEQREARLREVFGM